jgi:hypothetical protein
MSSQGVEATADGSDGLKPLVIDRGPCAPKLDATQLALQKVDATESVYTRQLVKFPDASLPTSIAFSSEPRATSSAWTAPAARRRVVFAEMEEGPTREPDMPDSGDEGDSGNAPTGGAPPTRSSFRPPKIFAWDLFLMLRYRQDSKLDRYGLGDLLYSVSLMPNEELTLELKTWETSRVQQDQDDTTEQRNASDVKSTSSVSSEVANRTESKEHEAVDAKASYSGFGFSAEVSTQWSNDVATMQSNVGKQAADRSEQASQEYRSTHKVRLTVSREEGSESKTTRRIRNINQAHTLNANYYEVLRQDTHDLVLYDASLVLLGDEAHLASVLPYINPDPSATLTLGYLIRHSRSEAWIADFIDHNGISPIKVLREAWARPLYDGALVRINYLLAGSRIRSELREAFRSTMLRFVRPTPGWIEPDETGALRWGYELYPEREIEALDFLYSFLPTSAQQLAALTEAKGADHSSAYLAVSARYAQAVLPSYVRVRPDQLRAATVLTADAAPPPTADNDVIRVPGPFEGAKITGTGRGTLSAQVTDLLTTITNNLKRVRGSISNNGSIQTWTTVLPTHGVYADLSLGICSGAEDYIEIVRQLDIERRRQELIRMQLENERLAQGGEPVPTVRVENASGQGQLNVDVDVATPSSARVDIGGR